MADPITATILAVAGTAVSAAGTIAGGQARAQASEFEARQYEARALEERAAGQQEAFDIKRKTALALSRNKALAGASGFSASDAGTLDLIGDIAGEGALQEGFAQYGAGVRAAGMRNAATGARMEGRAARTASYFDAAGTMLLGAADASKTIAGSGSTFFDKYAANGPPMDIRPAPMRYGYA